MEPWHVERSLLRVRRVLDLGVGRRSCTAVASLRSFDGRAQIRPCRDEGASSAGFPASSLKFSEASRQAVL